MLNLPKSGHGSSRSNLRAIDQPPKRSSSMFMCNVKYSISKHVSIIVMASKMLEYSVIVTRNILLAVVEKTSLIIA